MHKAVISCGTTVALTVRFDENLSAIPPVIVSIAHGDFQRYNVAAPDRAAVNRPHLFVSD